MIPKINIDTPALRRWAKEIGYKVQVKTIGFTDLTRTSKQFWKLVYIESKTVIDPLGLYFADSPTLVTHAKAFELIKKVRQ